MRYTVDTKNRHYEVLAANRAEAEAEVTCRGDKGAVVRKAEGDTKYDCPYWGNILGQCGC